jgi:hypothetical protein
MEFVALVNTNVVTEEYLPRFEEDIKIENYGFVGEEECGIYLTPEGQAFVDGRLISIRNYG